MAKPTYPRTIKRAGLSAKLYRYERAKNGATYVEYVLAFSEAGKRRLRSFSDAVVAEREAEKELNRIAAGIVSGDGMTATEREDYGLARKTVEPCGMPVSTVCREYVGAWRKLDGKASIAEAVAYFLKHATEDLPKRTVAQVADEMRKHKSEVDNVGQRHANDLKERLGSITAALGSRQIASVTATELNEFLFGIKGAKRTRYNYRTMLVGLFNFAKAKGYLPRDRETQAQLSDAIKGGTKIGKIEIFTPEEVRRILAKQDRKTIPFVAVNAFSGLRNAEICRLEWKDFMWDAGVIHVPQDKAKVGEERYVPIHPVLKAWLAPYREDRCEGLITFGVKRIQFMAQRNAARSVEDSSGKGLVPATEWKRNGLRHSFISYRLAATNNRAQVAEEAGNSVAMIRKHYRRPILPAEVALYWSLTPERACLADIIAHPVLTPAADVITAPVVPIAEVA